MGPVYNFPAAFIKEYDAGRLTQGAPGGPTGPLRAPPRTAWTLSRYRERAMETAPALVPGPSWLGCKTYRCSLSDRYRYDEKVMAIVGFFDCKFHIKI